MKNYSRLLILLLAIFMLVQSASVSVLAFVPVEVDTGIYGASGQPSKYSDTYNSGERDVIATTLSGTGASSYYTGSYAFGTLSTQNASVILSSLRTLMKSTHTKTSSYDDCKNMADQTDCENENGKVLLLYTSVYSTASAANSGWNREHVWPKSLGGYNTSGPGADLHHIRPTDNRVNSCRGNLKYGNVTGGKDATGGNAASGISGGSYGSYFEPLDNVKGDVARICLYMYVRYGGESQYSCGSITNVFQSIDVLLEWCEMDPVDTWELGRNEVVEAYQGNRNVFIDYPEYAWLLFGRDVPEDMTTPSGEASGGITGSGTGGDTGDNTGSGSTTPSTSKEILDAAYDLSSGQSLDGTYTLTGVITKLDSYNNPTIVVDGYTSQPMYCYRLVDSRFVIGATITVTGTIMNYQGTVEMKDCTLVSITLPSDEKPDTPEEPEYTAADFTNAVDALSKNHLRGEEKYDAICSAIEIYNSLSDTDKTSVVEAYNSLKLIASDYNQGIESVNSDSDEVMNDLSIAVIVIATATLPFALIGILGKKYI